jgi:hypothetical protein
MGYFLFFPAGCRGVKEDISYAPTLFLLEKYLRGFRELGIQYCEEMLGMMKRIQYNNGK